MILTSMELMRCYGINFQTKVDCRYHAVVRTITTIVPILSWVYCVLFSQNCLSLKSHLQCYNSSSKNFIQIINVESKHWICASNIHCPAEVVDVYDSKPSFSIVSHNMHKQLATIMQCSAECMYVCPPYQCSETIWTI